ncbi:GNAT family N-acetyltransferase [Phenylobacterium kunshanense]|uniref:GNAT family N-acetyltransferase n=1 Tax=Phenylobacterium kunshanense TaxID=1445034 RepID=A0A328BVN5_9CAUL|nr:GNAT family N-acetyltransferase [Phenylobacterium kunshanense]RAK69128.1 GNAT family N-acetyltransferase [Phenylobacterium kunshanense]
MDAAGIESLERATVEAVAPPEVLEIGGWIVPFDHGTIGRAKSAAPLRHDLDAAAVGEIVAAYRARGLPPAFRIADVPAFDEVRAALSAHGLTGQQPTVMKVGDVAALAAFSDAPARVLDRPDEAWAAVFLGEGFDPADGAHRVAALSRSPGAVYGAAGEGGLTQAVGVASFGQGWAGIHGMRTAPAARGRGHAGAILAALGRAMRARGIGRVFLQVEEGNPARRIYRRAGFAPVWTYRYWR